MRRRVVVTGLGAITPLGVGLKRSWTKLINSESGIVSTRNLYGNKRFEEIPSQVAAVVPHVLKSDDRNVTRADGKWSPALYLEPGDERMMGKFSQFAVAAAKEACEDAGWDGMNVTQEERERAGVCLGSGIGNFDDVYNTSLAFAQNGYKKISPLFVPRLLINLAAGHISMRYNLQGPNHAVSTACTTGLHSIGDASRFITHGDADLMIAGGSESCIHPLALAGFARAKSLATNYNDHPTKSSRPFDRERDGFVMGEGAGVLILEELQAAKRRGVKKIYAEVKGYGLAADAHHITSPPSDGVGAYRAMRNCLRDAGVRPESVDYVNAHATGTKVGDLSENRAIKRLMLGEFGRKKAEEINVSSVKGAIGHLLGAAGAVESIMSVLAVYHNTLPPTLNLEDVSDSEEFDCNYVPLVKQEREVNVALTNSFGFGGTNASLCFTKFEE